MIQRARAVRLFSWVGVCRLCCGRRYQLNVLELGGNCDASGFQLLSSYSPVIARSDVTATGGGFVTPFSSNSRDIGTDNVVPASYMTYQLDDRLFAGLGLNSPFGFITKPDNTAWAGSPAAITSKVFSIDANPTLAYKVNARDNGRRWRAD